MDPETNSLVTGYALYYGTTSQHYSTRVDAGANTSATISSLQGGKTYYFAATAYDSSGDESPFSSEVSYNAPRRPVHCWSTSARSER